MSFNDVIDGFTRGDRNAPPQVWAMWETPDMSTFPDDASDENPYMWHPAQGAWATINNIERFNLELQLADLQQIDQSLLSVVEVTELQARIKKLETS